MKNHLLSLSLAACMLACSVQVQAQPAVQNNGPVQQPAYTAIAYAAGSPLQNMDIFIPAAYAADKGGRGDKNTLYPVIVAITNMNDSSYGDISLMLNALPYGYAVAAVKYRSSFPQSIQDIFSAVGWLNENGKQYKLHPDRIILWGTSNGGYLAALAGCAGTYAPGFESEMDFDTPEQMAKAQATEQAYQKLAENFTGNLWSTSGNKTKVQAVIDYYGTLSMPGSEVTPQMFITPQTPPFFMVYGQKDPMIPYTEAESFSKALQESIGSSLVEFLLLPDAGHGGARFENPQLTRQIFTFLHRVIFY